MSNRRIAPLVLVALAAALGAAVVMLAWPDDGTASGPVGATVATPSTPWPVPTAAEVAALPQTGCSTVRYTPPAASTPHDADMCRPAQPSGQAVVLIHGGGGYTGSKEGLEPWARWYRSQGLVTLAVDYTLVGDGTAPPVYPAPERDVKAAVQFLRRFSPLIGINPEAILVHGSSAGARLGAQALVTGGDPWFASPDLWPDVPDHVNGLVGFYGYYDGTSLVTEDYLGGTTTSTDPAVQERLSHADSIGQAPGATGPALLFHGDIDGLVDVGQTERFGRALIESGRSATTRILIDENHAFDQRPGDPFTAIGRRAAREILDWLSTALPTT